MKKIIFFLPLVLFANILSDIQKKSFSLEKEKNIKDAEITKKSWLNPIMVQYTITRDNNFNTKTTKTFTISINQPIFKSGAIIYSIKYAKDLKNLNLKNLELKKRELIKNALDLAYDYKITKLNEEILKLKIQNALIDVNRKKEEYRNGTLDMTFLNNSIISLNSLKLSLEDIKKNLANIKYSFQNLSDMNINEVHLNLFRIIPLESFLKDNIKLQSKKISQKVNKDLYRMQIGDTLFTVFINGSYNYQEVKNDKNNFYTAGVGVSIPLDFRAKDKIQKAKVTYFLSKLDYLQEKRTLKNRYKAILSNIKTYQKKIEIYQDNINLYNELIYSTKNYIKAGTATKEDLEILENSKRINLIEIEILKNQIQKELLSLYYLLKSFNFSN